MSRRILIESTADGSDTLFVPSLNEHYHSVNGAIQESMHVYIESGLKQCSKEIINVLEIGFGTGLNAFLTLREANETKNIHYTGIELYPLSEQIISNLNYTKDLNPIEQDLFNRLHQTEWNREIEITSCFNLKKIQTDFSKLDFSLNTTIDLIYFDAFAPEKQKEMWSQNLFDFLYTYTNSGGILTTYCAKGVVRRMLQQAGYIVERLQGPPGKREMLRAIKY